MDATLWNEHCKNLNISKNLIFLFLVVLRAVPPKHYRSIKSFPLEFLEISPGMMVDNCFNAIHVQLLKTTFNRGMTSSKKKLTLLFY